jgi:hypothetical protein
VSAIRRFGTKMHRFGLTAIALAALTLAVTTAAVAKERWENYANPKFGASADYPADLFTVLDPPPEIEDGQSFHTADGRAELSIYGAWNANDDTPKSYVENYVEESGAGISYRQITDHFFVVSGTKDGKIFYQRCNFLTHPDAVVHCFSISYPEQQKEAWDKIVSRVSGSLR